MLVSPNMTSLYPPLLDKLQYTIDIKKRKQFLCLILLHKKPAIHQYSIRLITLINAILSLLLSLMADQVM